MGQLEYFPAFFGYLESLKKLDDAQVGRVFRAALRYAKDGAEPDLDPVEDMAFTFIRGDIDRAKAKYEEKCERLRANGMKKWENAAESKSMQLHADASESMQMDADAGKQDKTKQNKTKQHNTNEGISASADAKPARGKARGSVFTPPTVEEVQTYCTEAGLETINPEAFVDYYNANGWKVGSQSMKDWKATLRNWSRRDKERGITAKPEKRGSFDTDEFFAAALAKSQRQMDAMDAMDAMPESKPEDTPVSTGAPKGWEGIW